MKPSAPTTPPPPTQPPVDRRFAKDVAKHLDRRRMRRRLLLWALLVGAIVFAALYGTCGRGFGLFGAGAGAGAGKGKGSGAGASTAQPLLTPVDAGPRRCSLRVAASGITADGAPATVAQAVAACKGATAAEVLVTGGARQGDWEDLKAALDTAGIPILRAEPRPDSGSAGAGSAGSGG
jgi:hypothetical protein